MCKADGESIDHLFLHCPMAYDLWSFVFSLFRVHWVMPSKVLDLLACWQGIFGQLWSSEIWAAIQTAYCGACGRREILGFYRIVIRTFLILDYSSCVPCLIDVGNRVVFIPYFSRIS